MTNREILSFMGYGVIAYWCDMITVVTETECIVQKLDGSSTVTVKYGGKETVVLPSCKCPEELLSCVGLPGFPAVFLYTNYVNIQTYNAMKGNGPLFDQERHVVKSV